MVCAIIFLGLHHWLLHNKPSAGTVWSIPGIVSSSVKAIYDRCTVPAQCIFAFLDGNVGNVLIVAGSLRDPMWDRQDFSRSVFPLITAHTYAILYILFYTTVLSPYTFHDQFLQHVVYIDNYLFIYLFKHTLLQQRHCPAHVYLTVRSQTEQSMVERYKQNNY